MMRQRTLRRAVSTPLAEPRTYLTLLLRHTHGPAPTTSCLGVLATHAEAPVVTQTTMRTDLLQSFQIVTELRVDTVGEDLRVLTIHNIALSVEEPAGDLVLCGVLDDGNDALEFFRGEFTGTICVLELQVR